MEEELLFIPDRLTVSEIPARRGDNDMQRCLSSLKVLCSEKIEAAIRARGKHLSACNCKQTNQPLCLKVTELHRDSRRCANWQSHSALRSSCWSLREVGEDSTSLGPDHSESVEAAVISHHHGLETWRYLKGYNDHSGVCHGCVNISFRPKQPTHEWKCLAALHYLATNKIPLSYCIPPPFRCKTTTEGKSSFTKATFEQVVSIHELYDAQI